ncbi:MAG: aspartate dehydrogenase [Gammaproteobacteria bacterium]|jgi:aspartate dehydrogenase
MMNLPKDLEAIGKRTGHRLRLVGGAVAGLDAAAVGACDPNARMSIRAVNEATKVDDTPDFAGTAREAIKSLPGVNCIAAVALAGQGLDNTHFTFFNRDPKHRRLFYIDIVSDLANYTMTSTPNVTPEAGVSRTVAASVIAALIQAQQTIWAG